MTKPKHTKAESPVIHQPNLEYYRAAFGRVGCFIPPYVTLSLLGSVAKHMQARGNEYQQAELEAVLAHVYSDAHLARISHGRYADDDYGSPLNFYKVISCVDMLCFISSFRGGGSWLAPSPNAESERLLQWYRLLRLLANSKATALGSPD